MDFIAYLLHTIIVAMYDLLEGELGACVYDVVENAGND